MTTDERAERIAYRLRQDGLTVAEVEGPAERAEAEAMRYAMQYIADGPVRLEKRVGRQWQMVCRVTTARWEKNHDD